MSITATGLRLTRAPDSRPAGDARDEFLTEGRQYQSGECRTLVSPELVVALMHEIDHQERLVRIFREGFEYRGQLLHALTDGIAGQA